MLKSFYCENHNCQKRMKKNILTCVTCHKKFCSNVCISEHLLHAHKKVTSKNLPKFDIENNEMGKDSGKKSDRPLDLKIDIQPELEVGDVPDSPDLRKPKSIYIKEGQYLINDGNYDPYYDFQNFELRRDQPLGKGAFGDVIIGIHKQDGKKFAIKQVTYLIKLNAR